MGRLLFGLLFVCSFCVPIAFAQTDGTGALSGFVKDSSGALVSGATVTVTNTQTGQIRNAITGASGSYSISLLPPGNYKVVFAAKGFKTLEVASATVNVTETDEVDGTLEVGSMEQSVTVSGTTEEIQRQ